MEPRIQYAQTEDGVSIAYWTLGEGAPLVWIANTVTDAKICLAFVNAQFEVYSLMVPEG